MRLGILGGTFDPVHYAHLLLAESCREQLRLDAVWFLPAATAPHKRRQEVSPAEHRVAMLELAIAGNPSFELCLLEVESGGVQYTHDTLARLREQSPDDELFLLLGGDMFNDLPNWRDPRRVCELAVPVGVFRPGQPAPDHARLAGLVDARRLDYFRSHRVEMPQMDLSATDLRRRAAEGLSLRYRTPPAVEQYIAAHGLYRAAR